MGDMEKQDISFDGEFKFTEGKKEKAKEGPRPKLSDFSEWIEKKGPRLTTPEHLAEDHPG